MLYLGVLPLILGREMFKVRSRCGAVVVRWPFWGGWGSRRDLVVWWCDVVCCGMRLAERSGAGGILEAVWWVARVEIELKWWNGVLREFYLPLSSSPLQMATAIRAAMREVNSQCMSR